MQGDLCASRMHPGQQDLQGAQVSRADPTRPNSSLLCDPHDAFALAAPGELHVESCLPPCLLVVIAEIPDIVQNWFDLLVPKIVRELLQILAAGVEKPMFPTDPFGGGLLKLRSRLLILHNEAQHWIRCSRR